jgi:altronate dehydratase small subunit
MSLKALVIHPNDNVANLIGPGRKGESVACRVEGEQSQTRIELLGDVPPNHKFAFADIKAGDTIVKYGLNIGKASADIRRGEHVHVHNIESNRGRGDLN